MKMYYTTPRLCLTLAVLSTVVSLTLGQGRFPSSNASHPLGPHDPKSPPPTSLQNAYVAVLDRLGGATNRFHCVSATCLEKTPFGLPGWSFTFSNTNGETARVEYYFLTKRAEIHDPKAAELLKADKP